MTDYYSRMRDLKVSYEVAAHGVQSAVFFEMKQKSMDPNSNEPLRMMKHLRTGLDLRAAEHMGLAALMIRKGIITEAEYVEAMRLAANEELARYTEHVKTTYNIDISFR